MVTIIGLTVPYPVGKMWPKDENWDEDYLIELYDERWGFYKATGEMFKPHERHPNRYGHIQFWYWVEIGYHPVFDEDGEYLGYYDDDEWVDVDETDPEALDEWLES